MCGIVGAATLGKVSKKQEEIRQESMIFLTTELLQLTQPRGADATGISALFSDGNYVGLKEGIPSAEFISKFGGTKNDYSGIVKLCRKYEHPVKIFLGHCRKTSVGVATDNANNHPIKVGDIVGVHNGTLINHDIIFDKLKCKRDGEVDTEAIIRLLHFYSEKGAEPFTIDMLEEACKRLEGTYSVIAFNANSPNQLITFRDSKPAELALIKPLNMILIASEKDYLKMALFRYNKQTQLYMAAFVGTKFPLIRSADIDFLTMPDDTAAIFNLADVIEKDAKIEDIFEKIKVLRTDKLWKKGTPSTYYPNQHHQGNKLAAKRATEKAAAIKKAAEEKKAAEKKAAGEENENENLNADKKSAYVWDKTKENFTRVEGIEDARKLGSIELGIEGNSVTVLNSDDGPTKEPSGIALAKVGEDDVDTLIGNTAEIEDVEPNKFQLKADDINKVEVEAAVQANNTVEVDVAVDAEGMEAAREAAATLPKYENDEDLLDAIGIDDKETLLNVPLHALANRIAKTLVQEAYYKGFVAKASYRKQTINLVKKKKLAENNIKALKIMTKILSTSANHSRFADAQLKDDILKATTDVLTGGETLTAKDIQSVFSVGDLRDNKTLKLVKEIIFEKLGG